MQLLPQSKCIDTLGTIAKKFSFPNRVLVTLSYIEKSYQFTDTPRNFPAGILSPAEQTAASVLLASRRTNKRIVGTSSDPDLHGTTPFLRELVVHGTEQLAIDAVSSLLQLNKPVVDLLSRLIHSEDHKVRRLAYEFLAQANPAEGRQLLRQGLADPDYRVRIEAMGSLAMLCSEGDDDQQSIVRMSKDASAGVRERCASLIKEHRWRSAILTLCELLSDPYDGGLDINAQNPDTVCVVARAAAKALEFLEPLPDDIIRWPHISIKRNSLPSLDMEVNAAAIELISKSEGVAQAIASLLNYDQLRSVVLRSLLYQVKLDPSCRDLIPLEDLLEIASDQNVGLSAWALSTLGALNQRAWLDCRNLLTDTSLAERWLRALIFGAGAVYAGLPVPDFLSEICSDKAGCRILERCRLGNQGLAERQEWLAGNDSVEKWLIEQQRQQHDDGTQLARRLLLTLLSNAVGVDLRGKYAPADAGMQS